MSNITKFIKHTIVQGDTIQSISVKYFSDVSYALEIAIMNDLDYPFIIDSTDTPVDNTKTVGDTILIPITIDDTLSLEDVSSDLNKVVLGSDIFLNTDKADLTTNRGGDFGVDTYGDLKSISGADCLAQDLVHALLTEKGSLPLHPSYGSDILKVIGNKNDNTWRQKAVLEVSKTILMDPRVVSIKDIYIERISTGVLMKFTIVTTVLEFTVSNVIKGV